MLLAQRYMACYSYTYVVVVLRVMLINTTIMVLNPNPLVDNVHDPSRNFPTAPQPNLWITSSMACFHTLPQSQPKPVAMANPQNIPIMYLTPQQAQ